jgi:hypothetical protein
MRALAFEAAALRRSELVHLGELQVRGLLLSRASAHAATNGVSAIGTPLFCAHQIAPMSR